MRAVLTVPVVVPLLGLALAFPPPSQAAAAGCRMSGAPSRLQSVDGNRITHGRISCSRSRAIFRAYGRLRCLASRGNSCPRTVRRYGRTWRCGAPTNATAQQTNTAVSCESGRTVLRIRLS